MWLKLPEGRTFNTAVARSLKIGTAGGADDNWAVIAEMPDGEDIVLAQFHLPQAAQDAFDTILASLKRGATYLDLT